MRTPWSQRLEHSPLWQLILVRMRQMVREPAALFWTFGFPLILAFALGLAFRDRGMPQLSVAVVEGPEADAFAADLGRVEGLSVERVPLPEAKEHLRRGRVALVVVPGTRPELVSDPTQADSRVARLLVSDALQRVHGRKDVLELGERQVSEPGARYIDFLIPGMLGLGLMNSALWGIGYSLVRMRTGKLMKRLVGTPMRRSHFLLSFLASRGVTTLIEVLFFAFFSRWLFGVRITGGVLTFTLFGMLGAFCFLGISLLVACRVKTQETANGLINVVSLPMMLLSGVFFSADRFPGWALPVIRALPLTAINDGLRAITNEGATLLGIWPQVALLLAWGGVSFAVSLRLFRWI